jgi:hypothetical protein
MATLASAPTPVRLRHRSARLKEGWVDEHDAWQKRNLSTTSV